MSPKAVTEITLKMGFSTELIDLLCQMLQTKAEDRITAGGTRRHPESVAVRLVLRGDFWESVSSKLTVENVSKKEVLGVKWTCVHEISGNCSAGREAFCVLLERLATGFHP